MNQGIDQRFTQRFMHWRIFNALATLQLKRHFEFSRQFLINLAEKVINIARPTAIGNQPVHPTLFRLGLWPLLVIHHVIRKCIADHFSPAKHQQTRQAHTLGAVFTVFSKRANSFQKFKCRQIRPDMAGLDG